MRELRVLIVDDSPDMRRLLWMILRRPGTFVLVGEASDGEEAIEQATRLQPDLILLDLRMPVLDGWEALPRIREVAPAARVVVVSGVDAREAEERAKSMGAEAYIDKGLSPARFQAALLELAPYAPVNAD